MKSFKYKTLFASIPKPLIGKERGLWLAQASLEQLRSFIPNVDYEKNYDLLGVSMPLFNVNLFNKNDDGVDTTFALQVYKTFINKFIDISHKRNNIIGAILSAHITEFGTDKPLTEDQVKNKTDVFNISVGGVLWRIINEGLAELIEESNSPLDENYDKIKASLEVGFTNFNVVVCPKGSRLLSEGRVVTDAQEKEKLSKSLKAFGGSGSLSDGSRVYRLLAGEGIGLGCGITESPAAELNAIATPNTTIMVSSNEVFDALLRVDNEFKQSAINLTNFTNNLINMGKEENKISQFENPDVIKDNKILRKPMKIKSIKDINDETLKEVTASSLVDFIETELKVASEKYAKEKQEKETLAQETQKKHDELLKTYNDLNKQLEELKANLQRLENEKIAREKQERFNVRMASFEDKFELSPEEVSVVATQIKDLDEEQYKTVETNLHILLKAKDRTVIAEQKKIKETKASETKDDKVSQTIEQAIDKAQQTSKEVAATTTVVSPTLKEKFAKAFAKDQFILVK